MGDTTMIEVLRIHPAVPEGVQPQTGLLEDTPLRPGIDYDLVNISLMNHDPVTKRSYEECSAEWHEAFERVKAEADKLRWWDIKGRFRIGKKISILRQRQGF